MRTDVFWKAAGLTIITFIVGLQAGIWLDNSRVDEIKGMLQTTDMQLLDARLQSLYHATLVTPDPLYCQAAKDANQKFNDRIYQQGLQLERYEFANRFATGLVNEKRRYALLQFQFWLNAQRIWELCGGGYSTVLYVYRYDTANYSDVELPQKLQSATLLELKERCGPALMLSPIPLDLNLTSIDLLVNRHDINVTPALIINDKIVLQGFLNITTLENVIEC